MPAALLAFVFWTAVVAIIVAQVMILRSTARVLGSGPRPPRREWGFALGPALVLALVLALSWRAAMRPAAIQVDVTPGVGEVRS